MDQQQQLPNATATLVMGILSLFFGCGLGLIFAIIGLIISKEGKLLYEADPGKYAGWGNLNAGRIMCIISLALTGVVLLILIIMGGTVLSILSEVAGDWY